ncbi:phage tail terminator protein [Dickeya ananatis]|uniref:phage tail terminator protein n=1 Tax=Dickeya ananatis TaxID=3061286 RepID=UPI000576B3E2
MKLSPIVATLRQKCPKFAGRVAGAAQLKALPDVAKMHLPAAYVVPSNDDAGENKSQTDYWQDVKEGFAVVVVLNNTADERGQAAVYDAVHDIRTELWTALLGLNPEPENGDVIQYVSGQVVAMDAARLYYQFDFVRNREISEEDTRQNADLGELPDLTSVSLDVDFINPGNGPDGVIEHHTEFTPPHE